MCKNFIFPWRSLGFQSSWYFKGNSANSHIVRVGQPYCCRCLKWVQIRFTAPSCNFRLKVPVRWLSHWSVTPSIINQLQISFTALCRSHKTRITTYHPQDSGKPAWFLYHIERPRVFHGRRVRRPNDWHPACNARSRTAGPHDMRRSGNKGTRSVGAGRTLPCR